MEAITKVALIDNDTDGEKIILKKRIFHFEISLLSL
jgi:hypothetical protein